MEKATFNKLKKRRGLSEDERRQLIDASNLTLNARNVLASFVTVAGKEGLEPWFSRFGMDYWPSIDAVSFEARVCQRTARTHLHELVALGILVPKYRANSNVPGFGNRRPVTYSLNLRALRPREGFSAMLRQE